MIAPVPLPYNIPLDVNVDAPVPPNPTVNCAGVVHVPLVTIPTPVALEVLIPVPPFVALIAVAFQVPVPIVPTVVIAA